MKERRLLEALGMVDEQYVEEAAPREEVHRPVSWLKWVSLVAGLCLVILGVNVVWDVWLKPGIGKEPETLEGGVTLPDMKWNSNWALSDMNTFFVYQGFPYSYSQRIMNDTTLMGEYLGTAVPNYLEWTEDSQFWEWGGNTGGEVYTVKGMNPNVMLCMPDERGGIYLYRNMRNVPLVTGKDWFEDEFHLSERYAYAMYRPLPELPKPLTGEDELIADFIKAVNQAPFGYRHDLPEDTKNLNYTLWLCLDNGIWIPFNFLEGGYVYSSEWYICLKIDDDVFNRVIEMLDAKENP